MSTSCLPHEKRFTMGNCFSAAANSPEDDLVGQGKPRRFSMRWRKKGAKGKDSGIREISEEDEDGDFFDAESEVDDFKSASGDSISVASSMSYQKETLNTFKGAVPASLPVSSASLPGSVPSEALPSNSTVHQLMASENSSHQAKAALPLKPQAGTPSVPLQPTNSTQDKEAVPTKAKGKPVWVIGGKVKHIQKGEGEGASSEEAKNAKPGAGQSILADPAPIPSAVAHHESSWAPDNTSTSAVAEGSYGHRGPIGTLSQSLSAATGGQDDDQVGMSSNKAATGGEAVLDMQEGAHTKAKGGRERLKLEITPNEQLNKFMAQENPAVDKSLLTPRWVEEATHQVPAGTIVQSQQPTVLVEVEDEGMANASAEEEDDFMSAAAETLSQASSMGRNSRRAVPVRTLPFSLRHQQQQEQLFSKEDGESTSCQEAPPIVRGSHGAGALAVVPPAVKDQGTKSQEYVAGRGEELAAEDEEVDDFDSADGDDLSMYSFSSEVAQPTPFPALQPTSFIPRITGTVLSPAKGELREGLVPPTKNQSGHEMQEQRSQTEISEHKVAAISRVDGTALDANEISAASVLGADDSLRHTAGTPSSSAPKIPPGEQQEHAVHSASLLASSATASGAAATFENTAAPAAVGTPGAAVATAAEKAPAAATVSAAAEHASSAFSHGAPALDARTPSATPTALPSSAHPLFPGVVPRISPRNDITSSHNTGSSTSGMREGGDLATPHTVPSPPAPSSVAGLVPRRPPSPATPSPPFDPSFSLLAAPSSSSPSSSGVAFSSSFRPPSSSSPGSASQGSNSVGGGGWQNHNHLHHPIPHYHEQQQYEGVQVEGGDDRPLSAASSSFSVTGPHRGGTVRGEEPPNLQIGTGTPPQRLQISVDGEEHRGFLQSHATASAAPVSQQNHQQQSFHRRKISIDDTVFGLSSGLPPSGSLDAGPSPAVRVDVHGLWSAPHSPSALPMTSPRSDGSLLRRWIDRAMALNRPPTLDEVLEEQRPAQAGEQGQGVPPPRPTTLKTWRSLSGSLNGRGRTRLMQSAEQEQGAPISPISEDEDQPRGLWRRDFNVPKESITRLLMWPPAGSQVPRCPSSSPSSNSWSSIDPSSFLVRSEQFTSANPAKSPALPTPVYSPLGVDVFHSLRKMRHVARHVELPLKNVLEQQQRQSTGRQNPDDIELPELLIVNIQLPLYSSQLSFLRHDHDGEGASLILYYTLNPQFGATAPESMQNLVKPLRGGPLALKQQEIERVRGLATGQPTTAFKERPKLLVRLPNTPPPNLHLAGQKGLSNWEGKPILTHPYHKFYRGPGYCEIDIDVHNFPREVRKGLQSLRGHLTDLVIDIALVIQGNKAEELPEPVLCCTRLHRLDLTQFGSLSVS